jgi:hypothetical protein
MSEKHYDGDNPNEPLPPEHFSPQERAAAKDLGDGSPAVDPRRGRTDDAKDAQDTTREHHDD